MSAHEDVTDALKQVTADDIVTEQFLKPVESALQNKGFAAKAKSQPGYSGSYEKIDRKPLTLTDKLKELYPERARLPGAVIISEVQRDFTSIAGELDSDYLAILEIHRFGIHRDFGPFGIPLGKPYAQSVVRSYLLDVSNDEVLFNDYGIGEVNLPDDWRQPNDWTAVSNATIEALEIGIERTTASLASAIGKIN